MKSNMGRVNVNSREEHIGIKNTPCDSEQRN